MSRREAPAFRLRRDQWDETLRPAAEGGAYRRRPFGWVARVQAWPHRNVDPLVDIAAQHTLLFPDARRWTGRTGWGGSKA